MQQSIQILIFLSFGLAMLTPWNFWIESSDWFKLKLQGTTFQQSYAGYISVVYQVFNIVGLIFFLKYRYLMPKVRIYGGFLMVCLVFVFSIILLYLPISSTAYFYFILSLVGFSAFAVASLSAIIALAGSFPPICMSYLYSGQGIAGILPLLIQLISQSGGQMNENIVVITSTISFMICVGGTFGYSKLTAESPTQIQEDISAILTSNSTDDLEQSDLESDISIPNMDISLLDIFNAIWYPCVSIFINLGVTLSLFPYVTAQVTSIAKMSNFVLFHFFTFNIFDFVGKTCTVLKTFNIGNPQRVFYLSLARLLFIPLILATNLEFYNEGYSRWFPLLFGDAAYFTILALFAFTNGRNVNRLVFYFKFH